MHGASFTFVALIAAAGAAASLQAPVRRTFDADKAGSVPPGFEFAAMRQPTPGDWAIRRAGTNGYLHHGADAKQPGGFAIAVAPDDMPIDLIVAVRMRLAGGARAGGVVWRYQDAQNFHAAILDLVRGEIALFRVAHGNLVRLESEDDLELDGDAWHTLRVTSDDDDIEVSLGGIRVFEEHGRSSQRSGGRAGVIATGASEIWFDDYRVEAGRKRR